MKLRSLLLGSAAAMVAVSGAQAADAIVVEPHPVEYVRICDAYGTGFFYIPGTETCIRFSGFIRTSYEHLELETRTSLGVLPFAVHATGFNFSGSVTSATIVSSLNAGNFSTRVRLNIDTRNETDWGTLRGLFRLEAGSANATAATAYRADVAMISLAGFRLGQNGGNYWSANHGFAGVNLEGVGGIYSSSDGWYGFADSQFFDYTWAGDGLSITVGIEDARTAVSDLDGSFLGTNNMNVYAGFNYSMDLLTIAGTWVHDANAVEISALGNFGTIGQRGGDAWKVSATLNLGEWIPGGILHAWYMDDGDHVTDYVTNVGVLANPESVWGVGFQMNLTDEVEFVALYNEADGGWASSAAGGTPPGSAPCPTAPVVGTAVLCNEGDAEQFVVGLNWYPAAAPGFHIKTSYMWGEANNSRAGPVIGVATPMTDYEWDGFEIVVRRDF